jgi:hypothetical protein
MKGRMMNRPRRRLGTAAFGLSLVASGLGITACTGGGITASTTCAQYLQQSQTDRYDDAVRLSAELHATDPGNPMWSMSLDSACGADPNMTLGQYFTHSAR